MRMIDRTELPGSFDAFASCAACQALDFNLCHAMMHAAKETAPASLQASEHMISARRSIWREREPIEIVPVICQGWAATAVALPDGRRQILSFLLPGDLVSAALIFAPASSCSVEAITDIRYRAFQRSDIKAVLSQNPDLIEMLSRISSEETTRANQLAVDLGRCTATERIARLILNLSDRLAQRGLVRNQTMDFPLRQHHIADATGLTVVHVGNVLSQFRQAGLVDINERTLTISDLTKLRRIADML
jgi:CRP/FNR family transcriptional regulator